MPDISALYPQAQPQKPFNPFEALGALSNVLSFQKNQLELNANRAIGEEYRNALSPGGLDTSKLAAGLKSNPATGYGLPEATSRLIAQQGGQIANRGGQISNTTAQFQQLQGMSSVLTNGIASLANDTDLDKEKVLHWATTMARTTGIPGAVLGPWVTSLPNDPKALRSHLNTLLQAGLGPAGVAQRIEGPPGPGGSPGTIPMGAAISGAAGGGTVPGQVYTGQPIGEEIPQKGSAARAESLAANASSSPQIHANLDNLAQDSKILGNLGGPTIEVEKKLNQLSQRLGGFGITMTTDQLRALESYDKIAATIAGQQASSIGAATDAGRHMTEQMNPHSSMSQQGREAMTGMLHGNQDFIDAAAREWAKVYKGGRGGVPASYHDEFMRRFTEGSPGQPGADPRVFQYNRLSPEHQKAFLATIGTKNSPEAAEFVEKYEDAIKRGWVKPPKGQKTSALGPPVPGARRAPDGEWYVSDPGRDGKYMRVNLA